MRRGTPGRGARLTLLISLLIGAVLLAVGLYGCSILFPRDLSVADPLAGGSAACRTAAAHWPKTVAGQTLRKTSSTSVSVRAWGDPPVIARCGLPAIGPTTDPCIDVSGIDWVAHRLKDGVRFSTYGRTPAIEVLVPSAYQPEPLLLPAFGQVAAAIPQGEQRCQ